MEQLRAPRQERGRAPSFQAVSGQTQSTRCIRALEELLGRMAQRQLLGEREVLGVSAQAVGRSITGQKHRDVLQEKPWGYTAPASTLCVTSTTRSPPAR